MGVSFIQSCRSSGSIKTLGLASVIILSVLALLANLSTSSAQSDSDETGDLSFSGILDQSSASLIADDALPENWPPWLQGWSCDGSVVFTNPAVWYIPASQSEGTGSLCIKLDRPLLTNDLVMEIEFFDHPGASLFLSLADTNSVEITAATNLYGNLILGSNELVRLGMPLPLADNPAAAIIRLHRGTGEILLYDLVLRESTEGAKAQDVAASATTRTLAPASAQNIGTTQAQGENDTTSPYATAPASTFSPDQSSSSMEEPGSEDKPPRGNRTIYVHSAQGDDYNDGFASVGMGSRYGPKKTLTGGLAATQPGDTLVIMTGTYREKVSFSGKGLSVQIRGSVNIY